MSASVPTSARIPRRFEATPVIRKTRTIGSTKETRTGRPRWALVLLFATWVMPFVIFVGPVRLSPYRIALLALFVPVLVWFAQGRAGKLRLADLLLAAYAIWCLISLTVLHGAAPAAQAGGIQMLETLTPYLLARCCIRDADDFLWLSRGLTVVALVLLPFALFEAVTGRNLYLELASHIYPSIGVTDKDPRLGLRRVQLFFEHPILMGVCMGAIVTLTHMVVGRESGVGRRWLRTMLVVVTGMLSLSSGPISGIMLQVVLMVWNWTLRWLKARWMLLFGLIGLFVLAVELFAKRPLPNILLSFAIDQQSAFFRIVIWNYGTLSVANHPLVGVGLGPWDHPDWMGPSIDMYWLYQAIIYGLPAGVLMMAFFISATLSVGLVRNLVPRHYDYRVAYLISMASFFLTGWMVHFWNGTYVFFLFMVGSGMWLLDVPEARAPAPLTPRRSARIGGRKAPHPVLERQFEPIDRQPRGRRKR